MRVLRGHLRVAVVLAATVATGGTLHAGGYDTPMLYSARHMGMGGTAIGYVNDASALYHNPAGLAHTGKLSLLADFSLLLAHTRASPDLLSRDLTSQLTVAPLFLVGAGYRLSRLVTVGLGVYPVASAGATYEYPVGDATVKNRTRLVFAEASPAIAFNLPYDLRLGLGYRVTYVSLERFQGVPGAPGNPGLDFTTSGTNWAGFRLGLQWTPRPWLSLGASYRHKTSTKVTNDRGIALGMVFEDIETEFVLPSKLGLGSRADVNHFGFALDAEYTFNSQNQAYPLVGTPEATAAMPLPMRLEVPNVFRWSDQVTVRGGMEYRTLPRADGTRPLALRAGYIFDGKTTNPRYPSAFGTPPGPTQVLTTGAGYRYAAWDVNVAYAYRFGSGEVTTADVNAPDNAICRFCGIAGNEPYHIRIHGLYVDVSYKLP